jgi:type II secretory pathway component GspD/PulD (secretin)
MKQIMVLGVVGLALVIGVSLAADNGEERASTASRLARTQGRPIDVSSKMVEIDVQIVETSVDQDDEGLDPTVASEDAMARVRELEKQGKLDVVNRIQLTTLDQQPAFVQVGERRPVVISQRIAAGRPVNSFQYENVGTILGVTPRIAGTDVVMELDIEKSRLDDARPAASDQDDDDSFVPPRIVVAMCQTTIRVAPGQTVIAGGMQSQSDDGNSTFLVLATARVAGD